MRIAVRFAASLVIVGLTTAWGLSAPARGQSTPSPEEAALLESILESTKAYCRKLDNFAFEIACREVVTEDLAGKPKVRMVPQPGEPGMAPTMSVANSGTRNTYIYNYHLIREQRISRETRILVERNRRRLMASNVRPEALRFHFENMTFGPIDLFGVVGRLRHEYRVVGRETFKGEKAIIVEAVPNVQTIDDNPGAKVWVREGDSAVLKIEWDPATLSEYEEIKAAAAAMDETPVISLITEYGIEKDGFRFPNRFFIREAYLQAKTRKTEIASEVTVEYRDYKFIRIVPDPVDDDGETP